MMFRHLVPFLWVLALSLHASLAYATLDAIFANANKSNQVCLGNEGGNFACRGISVGSDFSEDVALGDVNDDTLLDAVFAKSGISGTNFAVGAPNQVCLGNGRGSFVCSDVSADANFSRGVALGDVNGDSLLDAVFANFLEGLFTGEPDRVCLGDGIDSFVCSDVSADANSSLDVALGDVNGDSLLDVVFANMEIFLNRVIGPVRIGAPNRVCLGNGAGSFTCSDVSADANISRGVALGDVNGDTFLDAVFANASFPAQPNRVCLGDGMGSFACSDVSADIDSSEGVALGDVNGDTFLDAVFASDPNQVCLGRV